MSAQPAEDLPHLTLDLAMPTETLTTLLVERYFRDPRQSAALWLLMQAGDWLSDPEFRASCLILKYRGALTTPTLQIKWTNLARLAVDGGRDPYQAALALTAAELSGMFSMGGSFTYARDVERTAIYERDGWSCVYCGIATDDLTLDHVIPRCRGGAKTWDNLVAACHSCNLIKANHLLQELGWVVRHGGALPATQWTPARVADALGPVGQTLVAAATYRRDSLADRLAAAVAAGHEAAMAALGLSGDVDDQDQWGQALLASLARSLAPRRGLAEPPLTEVIPPRAPARHLVAV